MGHDSHGHIDFHYSAVARGLKHGDYVIILSWGFKPLIPVDIRLVALVQEGASPSGGKI